MQTTLSAALHTDSQATTDLAFGRGHRYELADGHLSLEVFLEGRLSRITTPTTRVELFAASPRRVVDGQVVFDRDTGHEDVRLSVSPDGTVVFGYVYRLPAPDNPADAPEPVQEPPLAAPAGQEVQPPPPAAGAHPPEASAPATPPAPADRTAGTPEQEQAP